MVFSKTTWTDITPAGLGLNPHSFPSFGVIWVEVAKSNPNIVYACVDDIGLFRSTDYGQNFTQVGTGSPTPGGPTTTKLDGPFCLRINPADSTHLVATQGVRGSSLGFWVSHDSGATWSLPAAFAAACTTVGIAVLDVTTLAVDPTDFNHMLVGSHGNWTGYTGGGILETFDGGTSWTIHYPVSTWPPYTHGIKILYDPDTAQGNASTWIVMTDGDGFWRTTNSGTSWTQVYTGGSPHGGTQAIYDNLGNLWAGGGPPVKSVDNGVNWTTVTLPINWLAYSFACDSNGKLYTNVAYTGDNALGYDTPVYTSIDQGATWQSSSQVFSDGPYTTYFVPSTGIMYFANWAAGLWAIQAVQSKIVKPTWSDITPAGTLFGVDGYNYATGGCCVDSSGIFYFTTGGYKISNGATAQGMIWRSTNQGTSWTICSPPEMDQPIGVIVNPSNRLQLKAWDGVRGTGFGLWESSDGGGTWVQNPTFLIAAYALGTADTYHIAVEPGNWNHILATFHSYWNTGIYTGTNASGVLRSTDGGLTWAASPVKSEWAFAGGYNVHFLYNPTLGIGNANTWLFCCQTAGLWKTTDAGATWTQVSTTDMTHGGSRLSYDANGNVYVGSNYYLQRSTDNGDTWSLIDNGTLPFDYYFHAIPAAGKLWTLPYGGGRYKTSSITDGITWADFSTQSLPEISGSGGSFDQSYDYTTGVLYSAQQGAGIWALKAADVGVFCSASGISVSIL